MCTVCALWLKRIACSGLKHSQKIIASLLKNEQASAVGSDNMPPERHDLTDLYYSTVYLFCFSTIKTIVVEKSQIFL